MKTLEIFLVIAVSLLISSTSCQLVKSQIINHETLTLSIQRGLSDQLKNFLENKLRRMMINGDDKLNLPVLDPLHGFDQPLDLEIDDIKISAKMDEYHVEGLSRYVVKKSGIHALKKRIDISMNFPTIAAHGLYNLDGSVGENTSVYGTGTFNMTCRNFSFSAVAYVSIFGGVKVKSLDLKISLKELDASITGLMNDERISWILSEVISDLVPKMIDNYHNEIVAIISKKAIEVINSNLEGKSLSDLYGLLS